jgi:hypothetical protein
METNAIIAARTALAAHTASLGIEGDLEVQIWHLLHSLLDLCDAEAIDLDNLLADVGGEREARR